MSSDIHLNIITFDIPYPANYGGVIDVFYKLQALTKAGINIHLHNFQYGREASTELEKICHKTYYYPRKPFGNPFRTKLPYIVKTRWSEKLLHNLLKNDYPILFEGLHCTFYIDNEKLKNRLKIVRMHNIEYLYYKHLAKVESNFLRKYYFNSEANRLRKYQQKLNIASYIAAISPSDHKILKLKHGNSFYLPVFHPNQKVTSKNGIGDYVLYHGNLGVGENNEAALFLVNNVLNDLKIPTIIAGNNPSKELQNAIKDNYHIKLITPKLDEIYPLIENAQINILPTFQDTGIKLKLLNALFMGRFCIVNNKMIKDTGLEKLCIVADDITSMKEKISEYYNKNFNSTHKEAREKILNSKFDNNKNIKILISKIK
ncbi:MAG: glycosyltransferase family 4 protein [Bacteroidota bacterium]|nr:glycosyltransferase family 4 protein [Bacteroidota bacterium]